MKTVNVFFESVPSLSIALKIDLQYRSVVADQYVVVVVIFKLSHWLEKVSEWLVLVQLV